VILQGNCLDVLKTMPSESVQCCVTSPPYWGLRDYGHAGQMGQEKTPAEYVSGMVAVFEEVRRVLKPDGVLWLNLGDSYATGGGSVGRRPGGGDQGDRFLRQGHINTQPNRMPLPGLKPKDLIGIPWRVAFALQEAGWYLRCDVIWLKPNPMPESVTDRPTKSHEYIFLLSKSERYAYNSEAIKEPASQVSIDRLDRARLEGWAHPGSTPHRGSMGARAAKADKQRGHGRRHAGFNDRWDAMSKAEQCGSMRNKRSVWNIATRPFSEAHFATFPEEIPTICIMAGSKPGDTVLDPFSGAGTVGVVCEKLRRKYIGVELTPAYVEMSERRIAGVNPMFSMDLLGRAEGL
jgi:DNA modification methylase